MGASAAGTDALPVIDNENEPPGERLADKVLPLKRARLNQPSLSSPERGGGPPKAVEGLVGRVRASKDV